MTNRELFLSSPSDFNDPFDCRITKNFELLDTDEKLRAYAKIQSEAARERFGLDGKNISIFEQRIFDGFKRNRTAEQNKWDELEFRSQADHYGVLSFSEVWDSILMWGHYASNHTGFCIGFYLDKLRDFQYFGGDGPVNYSDTFPAISPLTETSIETLLQVTYTKAFAWNYEKEYRFIKLFFPEAANTDSRKIVFDVSCFAELLIGLRFPTDQVGSVLEFGNQLGIKVYQVKRVPFKFELTREEII